MEVQDRANYSEDDVIQLMEAAVANDLPPYANEDDMYEALSRCGMKVKEIFAEVDQRLGREAKQLSTKELAGVMIHILYDRYNSILAMVTAHKVPIG